ncbi:hypothetical protein M501DRAFT_1056672 [Patellaria atrata CBS 101060]|uniref:Prokaryotic-type class I peptide chain release factors domain-containing protein n=1 Tax=Patellaria atrata CBS 101060 TaxID=1346257 RepID=A0A9P4SD97_9PEZI|nr:hypothetical protein M501DRAFT_1056672 [Patellaria atrata CBS 101060]
MILRLASRKIQSCIRTPDLQWHPTRFLHTTSILSKSLDLPPRPTLNEADIEEAFLKGSGPGGQKINKTASAVQLKHLPTGLVIKCQATRSRSQNRKVARRLLAEKLDELKNGDQARTKIKAEVNKKRKASREKKARRKYRALEEGKEGAGMLNGEDEEDEEDEEDGEDGEEGDNEAGQTDILVNREKR